MSLNPQELKGSDRLDARQVRSAQSHRVLRETPIARRAWTARSSTIARGTQVMVRTAVKGTQIGSHFHTVSDEVVIVVGGRGELPINGEWKPVKQGDVHVCPRGIVHDTRALRRICSTSRSSRRTCRRGPISTGSSEPSLRRLEWLRGDLARDRLVPRAAEGAVRLLCRGPRHVT